MLVRFFCLHLLLALAAAQDSPKQPLVVLLLDGFRFDYLEKIPKRVAGFGEILNNGVRAEWVNGIFPTLSYPSWTTLSTGVYPETHGILGNYFYSREHKKQFLLEAPNNDTFWWNKAEPIWTTATKKGLRVATVLWSRSDVPVDGVLPEKSQGYVVAKGVKAIEKTLDTVVNYLEDGFDLVMAYGEFIDNVGHSYSPDAYEMEQGLSEIAIRLEVFFRELESRGLKDRTNVLIVADHGMTKHKKFLYIYDSVPKDDILYVMDQGAVALVYLKEGKSPKQTYQALKSASNSISVYLKEDIPKHFNYSSNPDCPDILVVANFGFTIKGSPDTDYQRPEAWKDTTMRGLHGYYPNVTDMRTIFMGVGPGLKGKGITVPAIDMVDIYQVYCNLLGIEPQPHNGTFSRVKDFLAKPMISPNDSKKGAAAGLVPCVLFVFVLAAAVFNLN